MQSEESSTTASDDHRSATTSRSLRGGDGHDGHYEDASVEFGRLLWSDPGGVIQVGSVECSGPNWQFLESMSTDHSQLPLKGGDLTVVSLVLE